MNAPMLRCGGEEVTNSVNLEASSRGTGGGGGGAAESGSGAADTTMTGRVGQNQGGGIAATGELGTMVAPAKAPMGWAAVAQEAAGSAGGEHETNGQTEKMKRLGS